MIPFITKVTSYPKLTNIWFSKFFTTYSTVHMCFIMITTHIFNDTGNSVIDSLVLFFSLSVSQQRFLHHIYDFQQLIHKWAFKDSRRWWLYLFSLLQVIYLLTLSYDAQHRILYRKHNSHSSIDALHRLPESEVDKLLDHLDTMKWDRQAFQLASL